LTRNLYSGKILSETNSTRSYFIRAKSSLVANLKSSALSTIFFPDESPPGLKHIRF